MIFDVEKLKNHGNMSFATSKIYVQKIIEFAIKWP
jgi:hypothetical protein